MKKIIFIALSLATLTAFSQTSKIIGPVPATALINCLKSTLQCTTPPIIAYNPTTLRGATAPDQTASDFVNYFGNAFSITGSAASADQATIYDLSKKQLPYSNLAAFIAANPKSSIAVSLQNVLNSSKTYDAFQSALSQLYATTSGGDRDVVFAVSNSIALVNQAALTGRVVAAAGPGCSGWWACWGYCAVSILAGAASGAVTGSVTFASSGSVYATAAGAVVGAIQGGVSSAFSSCK